MIVMKQVDSDWSEKLFISTKINLFPGRAEQ